MAQQSGYPVRVEVDYPQQSNRLLALLLVPHFIVIYFLGIVTFIAAIIGYFAVLFTGVYPRGLHSFITGVLRWQTRMSAWLWGLTDNYPPFSLT